MQSDGKSYHGVMKFNNWDNSFNKSQQDRSQMDQVNEVNSSQNDSIMDVSQMEHNENGIKEHFDKNLDASISQISMTKSSPDPLKIGGRLSNLNHNQGEPMVARDFATRRATEMM